LNGLYSVLSYVCGDETSIRVAEALYCASNTLHPNRIKKLATFEIGVLNTHLKMVHSVVLHPGASVCWHHWFHTVYTFSSTYMWHCVPKSIKNNSRHPMWKEQALVSQ